MKAPTAAPVPAVTTAEKMSAHEAYLKRLDNATTVRQGWRVHGLRSDEQKAVEAWERGSDISIAVAGIEMNLSVEGARKLARVLNDLAMRVEKRRKEAK